MFTAGEFIDASYEGDLMAAAGVLFQASPASPRRRRRERPPGCDLPIVSSRSQPRRVPYLTPPPGPVGSADARVQDANYRLCLSSSPVDRVPFTEPSGYDPAAYAVVAAYLAAADRLRPDRPLIGRTDDARHRRRTVDVNDGLGFSLALPGADWGYADASTQQRAAIDSTHAAWTQGLLWFLRTDASVLVRGPGPARPLRLVCR